MYFVHNHPNGTLRPSAPDENMCRRIFQTYS
ncbi:MAG: JAB domain-containing protein [Paramuribaculum sp.]|nr:JAB domain-containing protein [Paramuribaculum sp.]